MLMFSDMLSRHAFHFAPEKDEKHDWLLKNDDTRQGIYIYTLIHSVLVLDEHIGINAYTKCISLCKKLMCEIM